MNTRKIENLIGCLAIPFMFAISLKVIPFYIVWIVFAIGIVAQVLFYFQYKKEGKAQEFVQRKKGALLVSGVFILGLIVYHNFLL